MAKKCQKSPSLLAERVIYIKRIIKKISDKNKMIIFLIFLISFFIVLSIWYINKEQDDKKLVISKNFKEVSTVSEISIGLYSENRIENIDSIELNNESIRFISDLIYNGLFEFNEDLVLEAKLVENYAKVDEKNYVFKLNEEIIFQNGKKLTSQDVKNSIEKIFLNENSYYRGCIENIQNVKIIDSTTFRINLIETDDNFEENLIFPILCEDLNIGTNDYKIKEINDKEIILENEKIGQVLKVFIYEDLEMLYGDFKDKKLDLIKSMENMEYQKYIGEFGYQEKSYKGNNYIYFEFNEDGYFKDDKLKEAIFSSINCNEIIEKVFNKNAYDVKDVKYNLDKVIEILEEGGYVYKENGWYNKEKLLKLKILINKNLLNNLASADIIKEQLEKVGIVTEIITLEDEDYYQKIKEKDYDILIKDVSVNPWEYRNLENTIVCNKLKILYSLNLSGEITPNSTSLFHNIETWKKIVK